MRTGTRVDLLARRVTVLSRCDVVSASVESGRLGVRVGRVWSGGVPFVPMMQAADLRDRHNAAFVGQRDGARHRRVLVRREVRARSLVIVAIELHQPLQRRRAEHDDVIEALAPHGSEKPFDLRVLPRGARRREEVVHAHGLRRLPPSVECVIAIVEQ